MEITWVNHASFILKKESVSLLVDPWIQGRIFDESWEPLIETPASVPCWDEITHIWFSHEHPDHFSPPNLKNIPPEVRAKITVLYQETGDKKVIEFCKKVGFKNVMEVGLTEVRLDDHSELKIKVGRWHGGDSYLYAFTSSQSLLNLNDCVVDSIQKINQIKTELGLKTKLDVLMAQFSYASWAGNPGDEVVRQYHAQDKYRRLELMVTHFQPAFFVPFASYVYFCHEQNFHMNKGANTVKSISEFVLNQLKTKVVVLAPGNVWPVGTDHSNQNAVETYENAAGKVAQKGPSVQSKKISHELLKTEASRWYSWVRAQNPILPLLFFMRTRVRIVDLDQDLFLDSNGPQWLPSTGRVDLSLKSDALYYAFKHHWGFNTLHVNGRFVEASSGGMKRAFRYFNLADYANRGEGLTLATLAKKIITKLGF